MKLPLCALMLAIAPLAASAKPKGMGPSAIQAARLKKYPPPNYLSHYLPDDRYKVAGGVWKYVSTDLDTYYHIPSSPNMMRQPASRVIGFANSKDAEEAGYVADPTDGTASKVATPSPIDTKGGYGGYTGDSPQFNSAENAYRKQIATLFDKYKVSADEYFSRVERHIGQSAPQGATATSFMSGLLPYTKEYVKLTRFWFARFSTITPPPRFKGVHRQVGSFFTNSLNASVYLDQWAKTGDPSTLARATSMMQRANAATQKAFQLMNSIGH